MSETFTFDVNYSTTFEKLEALREKMLDFVKTEKRDYQSVFEVTVNGLLTDLFYHQVANNLTFFLQISRIRKKWY